MRWLERHAWWLLLAIAAVSVLFGVGDLLSGQPDNVRAVTGKTNDELAALSPDAYRLAELGVRTGGVQLLVIGTLFATILLVGFRQNRRWAWWTMWAMPIMSLALASLHLASVAPGQAPAVPVYSGIFVTVLAAAALLVSVPRFFNRSPS